MRRPGAAAAGAAAAGARSAASAATAAWRGLWGLPTWTHPGAPVLATYASALGPVQAPAVVHAEAGSVSTANTFTTANAQAVGGPTQYEFPGASLAWYAIGCYHLVCAMGAQGVDAERALAEARRWLAKATMAAPRSIVAWVAFAQTFAVAGEWEAAARALHTAAGLCGCDDVASAAGPSGRLAHVPLAILGRVYLRMGDLGVAESCLDASARGLGAYGIAQWAAAWGPAVGELENAGLLQWCRRGDGAAREAPCADGPAAALVRQAALADPQLLADVGVLHYDRGDMPGARLFFALALRSLAANSAMQHALHVGFEPLSPAVAPSKRPSAREDRVLLALFEANLGMALRRIGDYPAALLCLRASRVHASSSETALAVAFTLHMQAIAAPANGAGGLDEAIDIYHAVLSEHPGHPIATDLLTLALELSANLPDAGRLPGGLFGACLDAGLEIELEVGDPSDFLPTHGGGLLDVIPSVVGGGVFETNPGSLAFASAVSDDDNENGNAHAHAHAHDDDGDGAGDGAGDGEDSDQVMDIQEDSDSDSDSDMAMD
ncbi:anaphase-promoting complex subunit Cut9 [Kickxella alabastrina]|uniref:Anaphase-promoting complex subunit Cut9 n=1 Tax=Kickxella alabastrina TaxID=61397 RepID=A0ACC1I0C1_9FUNG|nr:anaphase-promoting complex subunit Cut9 [Kickxella alabastrina]